MIRHPAPFLLIAAALALAAPGLAQAPGVAPYRTVSETRAALKLAQSQRKQAAARAQTLEAEAEAASAEVDKTARATAAVAARIQQAEADIAVARAEVELVDRDRVALRARLAARQEPVVRLTGALQLMSRRPLALSVLRPGSLKDTVHLRAVLATMIPQVRDQTAGLRQDIARGQVLRNQALAAQADLREGQVALEGRRQQLAAIESRQRLASRAARGVANREQDRVLALAEQARDLGELVDELAEAGTLREQLAALPGPILRPARPGAAQVIETGAPAPADTGAPDYILPVAGRVVSGFGEAQGGGLRAQGLTLAPASGAQVVAPAAGRVAFAGPYQGYGRIVIIEHPGGWTTLVTGLARATPGVGDDIVQGSPLGVAGSAAGSTITVELRRAGQPVDIAAILRG